MQKKYVKLYIGDLYLPDKIVKMEDLPEQFWKCFAAEALFIATFRKNTGYKELAELGADWKLMNALEYIGNPSKTGGFKVVPQTDIYFGTGTKLIFFLDTQVFDAGVDVAEVIKTADPRWCVPLEIARQYDEDMFKELPEVLQGWFLKKIKTPMSITAQELLDKVYKKYVIDGAPCLQFSSHNSDHCMDITTGNSHN